MVPLECFDLFCLREMKLAFASEVVAENILHDKRHTAVNPGAHPTRPVPEGCELQRHLSLFLLHMPHLASVAAILALCLPQRLYTRRPWSQ